MISFWKINFIYSVLSFCQNSSKQHFSIKRYTGWTIWSPPQHLRDLKNPVLIELMFKFLYSFLNNSLLHVTLLKGCVHYIFASLFFKSKREHLSNQEKYFLFHLKSSFCSGENQILKFQIFKSHDIIKCQSIKQEIHFTE